MKIPRRVFSFVPLFLPSLIVKLYGWRFKEWRNSFREPYTFLKLSEATKRTPDVNS